MDRVGLVGKKQLLALWRGEFPDISQEYYSPLLGYLKKLDVVQVASIIPIIYYIKSIINYITDYSIILILSIVLSLISMIISLDIYRYI